MADPLDSQNIARHHFSVGRRGYEQQEVRGFLHEVSALVERLQREGQELRQRVERAEARLGVSSETDDTMLLEILGEETTRVLTSARDAAAEIRAKAEAAAERIISEATSESAEVKAAAIQEADRLRADVTAETELLLTNARTELERRTTEAEEAAARIREAASEQAQALRDEGQRDLERIREEADHEVEAARARGRDMVAEAQAVRERVLRDLAVRRKKARQQVEKLNAGRERLLQAYDVVRRTIDEATDELSTSLSDARLAADAAARRIEEEPEPTLEELDDEVSTAGLVDLPIADVDDHEDVSEAPGPFSGEVPVVVDAPAPAPTEPEAPVDLQERRGRRGRRRKETFEGLPPAAFSKVEPPADGEGIRILAEPGPEGAETPEEADAAPPAAEDVFARLRAERETNGGDEAVAEAEPEPEPEAEPGQEPRPEAEAEAEPAPEPEPAAEPEPTPFTERDDALAPIDKELARRLKRVLADEQNEVLDRLRRVKPKGVDDVLPDPAAHAGRWSEVVSAGLADAATAGATWAGGTAGSVADLGEALADSLTTPLRERIDRGFAASDGNLDDVADRVRALYREWKGQKLAETLRHHLAAAYARGAYDALPAGADVQWIVDPLGGPCPDCDDNVLGGVLTKGSEFPTGHQCAPAHPGCRCLVVAANR